MCLIEFYSECEGIILPFQKDDWFPNGETPICQVKLFGICNQFYFQTLYQYRLVSAYEDKMLSPHPFPFKYHHQVQQEILKLRGKTRIRIR